MEWLEGKDSWFVWGVTALVVHVCLSSMETASMRWVPSLTKSKFIMWVLVVWLLPFFGVALARSSLKLSKTKGGGHPDASRNHIQVFDD